MAPDSKQISDLYLNEKFSDVEVIIDNKKFPAHKLVLMQRCPYFERMFESGLEETKTGKIVVKETSITAFKSVLKWIYTGSMDLTDVENDIEILRLAHMYELDEVVELVADHLKSTCTVANVGLVLNEAVLYSLNELTEHLTKKWMHGELLAHETFRLLRVDSLRIVLTNSIQNVPSIDILKAFVRWMKANTDKKQHFTTLLKIIPLDQIPVGLVVFIITLGLIDESDIMKIAREQMTGINHFDDINVAIPQFGVNVVTGGDTSFFSRVNSKKVLKHTIGSSEEGIVVDLGRRFKLNFLKMHLFDAYTYSYWISVSEDNVYWTRVIDHSKYVCRSLQRLYFKERLVRYIRICGTAPANGVFEISRLEAFYTTEPFEIDSKTTLLIPSDNVALVQKNAIVIQGKSDYGAHAIINGIFEGDLRATGYTCHKVGDGSIIVQLPQPYLIDSMKLLLLPNGAYSYHVVVSINQKTWTRVFSEENVSKWREIRFNKQPVVFVKITGTYSPNRFFQCVHLECPAELSDQNFVLKSESEFESETESFSDSD